MSGALTERAFVQRLTKTGFFVDITVVERHTYGVADLATDPLFPDDLIAVMRRTIPADVQERIGVRLTVTARKPS